MDELYIRKVLDGDVNAFRYFVQQLKDMAFTIAMSILKNEFDAKDAVQEAFIIAFRKLNSFNYKSSFSTWYYRILVNESLKLKKRSDKFSDELISSPDLDINSSIDEIPSKIDSDIRKTYIEEVIKQIPSKQALALTLFYLKESSILEITNITGWSESNTKVLLSRGRKSFYNNLNLILRSEAKQLY